MLDEHPDVAASFVVVGGGTSDDKRLVAYVAPKPSVQLAARVLELFLRTRLPDYMVPSVFVQLDALPLTPNGKVDRTALPSPDATNILRDEVYAPPITDCEKQVTTIVSNLLSFDQVGANDNFFLLGGHSLLGTQLISRLRDVFGVELPLRVIFDHPTVRAISTEIEHLLHSHPLATTGRKPVGESPLSLAEGS